MEARERELEARLEEVGHSGHREASFIKEELSQIRMEFDRDERERRMREERDEIDRRRGWG